MKLYVDDLRDPPEGWVLARTYEEAIKLISDNWDKLELVSLDHDLGCDNDGLELPNGYDVALFIQRQVREKGNASFSAAVHSRNPVGRRRIAYAFIESCIPPAYTTSTSSWASSLEFVVPEDYY